MTPIAIHLTDCPTDPMPVFVRRLWAAGWQHCYLEADGVPIIYRAARGNGAWAIGECLSIWEDVADRDWDLIAEAEADALLQARAKRGSLRQSRMAAGKSLRWLAGRLRVSEWEAYRVEGDLACAIQRYKAGHHPRAVTPPPDAGTARLAIIAIIGTIIAAGGSTRFVADIIGERFGRTAGRRTMMCGAKCDHPFLCAAPQYLAYLSGRDLVAEYREAMQRLHEVAHEAAMLPVDVGLRCLGCVVTEKASIYRWAQQRRGRGITVEERDDIMQRIDNVRRRGLGLLPQYEEE